MKWALEGGQVSDRNPLPSQYRLYRLCRLFGWTVTEAEDCPAAMTDWFLAFADIEGR